MKNFFLQHRKALAASFLLAALLLLTRFNHYIIPRTPLNVTVLPIGTINKPIPITGTGSIESPTSVPITAEFSGRISEVYAVEGQPVKAGQPLVKLFGSPETAVRGITSSENQNNTPSSQAQTNYDNALKEYTRNKKLYEQGAIPRLQMEAAAARLEAVEKDLANSQAARQTPASTSAAIADGYAVISAPINGTVTGLSAAIDKMVQTGQQLMVLDSGEVQIVIPIEQQDLYLVHLGTSATIELSGQTLLGHVVSIYPTIGSNNTPSFLTHIKVTNDSSGLLKLGMSVSVHINTGKSTTVFAVPPAAVSQDYQGLHYIFLADNGRAIRQQIRLGESLGDMIEIIATLPQEAVVITSNINNINDGDPIVISE